MRRKIWFVVGGTGSSGTRVASAPDKDELSIRPDDAREPRRRWYRRPRWIVLAIVVLALVGGGIPFAIAWSHRGAKEASIDTAIQEFRKSHGASNGGFLRPPTGVYTFVGTGTEQLSLLKTTQHWGPHIPVTVTRDAQGCWTFRVDYSTHHWQSTRYCSKGRVLQQTNDDTFQSFDFVAATVSDRNETVCTPPVDRIRVDAKPGAQWHASCAGQSKGRGTKFRADGTDTFIGIEKLTVESDVVPTFHYRVERTLRGSQTGSERYDMWYSVLDGLPIKTDRQVIVRSPSPIGTVTYTEQGNYTLTSLAPQR